MRTPELDDFGFARHSAQLLLALFVTVGGFREAQARPAPDTPLAQARARLAKLDNTVFRTTVRPQWLPDNTRFWYRVETGPNTREYLLVDAAAGTRKPAFDAEKLSVALAQALDKPLEASQLDLERLEFPATNRLRFSHDGVTWECTLDDYKIQRIENADGDEPADTTAERSRESQMETHLVFENRTSGPVELLWIDTQGERHSYGTVDAGETRKQHTFTGHVWLVVDTNGRPLRRVEGAAETRHLVIDGKPRVAEAGNRPRRGRRRGPNTQAESPDGRWRAFIRDHDLFVEDRSTEGDDREIRLTTDGSAENAYGGPFVWSPSSEYLLVLQTEPAQEHKVTLVESSPANQIQPRVRTIDYLKPGDKIAHPRPRLFQVAEKRVIPIDEALFPNPWSIDEFQWSPDSRSVQFLYNQRGHQVLRLLSFDTQTGDLTTLIDETSKTFIDYAGKQFLARVEGTGELIWMSERDGWNHLWLIDGQTGAVKNPITRGEWVVRSVEQVDDEKRQVWFFAGGVRPGQDPYYLHLCRVNFDGTGLTVLTEGDGTHTVSFSPDRKYFVDTYSRVDMPPVNELRASDDGRLVAALETGDCSRLLATGWAAPERIVSTARDGKTEIYGVLVKPTDFDPTRKYPVVEQIYAGPQAAFVPKSWGPPRGLQEMAELGFIVVQIDGMGTSFRSKAFHDVCWKNLADAGLPDRVLWLRHAADERPYMDLNRVGVYGGSAGGQNALRALLDHGDVYKVGVADCGCHDNRMDKIWWNELWMGWPVGPEYEASSNVTAASKLTGKLLLIVGELDNNVDPASTMQVVNALIKADKDFDFLIIPGASHGAAETPYGRRRRAEFLLRHLGPPTQSGAVSAAGGDARLRHG